MSVLYLCEKPSQAADLAKVLGDPRRKETLFETAKGVVTYAIGHLLELDEPGNHDPRMKGAWRLESLPFEPLAFRYVPKQSTRGQLSAIGKLLKSATTVVIATDAGREGEMIGREILDYCGFRGEIKRLWLSALDEGSIKNALRALRRGDETVALYEAALARNQADWVVGINLTRAATTGLLGSNERKTVLSVGRVQTPTLALVVKRDREIEGFIVRSYYEIEAQVETLNGVSLTMRYAPKEEARIWDQSTADALAALAKGKSGAISVSTEEKRTGPPRLFSLSSLQKEASQKWGWTADSTLEIAQSLYERHKAVTYPRTDCQYLPEEQIQGIEAVTKHLFAGPFASLAAKLGSIKFPLVRKNVFNTAKLSEHHAIIPTAKPAALGEMTEEERKAYFLIAGRYLQGLMPDYVYLFTKVLLPVEGIEFQATGHRPLEPGWKEVFRGSDDENETREELPQLMDGETAIIRNTIVVECQTKPPARYTDGTLIDDMKTIGKFVTDPALKRRLKETSGLGTEATRAAILKNLRDRRFIELRGKHLVSTPLGRALIGILEQKLPALIEPGMTAVWETELEEIAQGSKPRERFLDNVRRQVREYVGLIRNGHREVVAVTGIAEGSTAKPLTFGGITLCDRGAFFESEHFPGVRFYKELCGRRMTAQEIASVLGANGLYFNEAAQRLEFDFSR